MSEAIDVFERAFEVCRHAGLPGPVAAVSGMQAFVCALHVVDRERARRVAIDLDALIEPSHAVVLRQLALIQRDQTAADSILTADARRLALALVPTLGPISGALAHATL
jgi:RecA/RadA recombinase